MTVIVSALLLTEPSLPLRASIALGVMSLIGLSWMGFAVWVLTERILLGRHRIVAGRMAVGFTTVFCIGAFAVGYATASRERGLGRVDGPGHARDCDNDVDSRQASSRTLVATTRRA